MLTIGESDKRDDVRDGMKERGEDGAENNQSLKGARCAHYYYQPGISYSVIKNVSHSGNHVSILRGFYLNKVFRRGLACICFIFVLKHNSIVMFTRFIMRELHAHISISE